MIKVLVVDVMDTVGGIETLFHGLFGKDQKLFDVSFLTYCEKCAFENEYISYGYHVHHLPSRGEHPFLFNKNIRSFFEEHNDYDYVWVNTASTSMYQCQYYAKRLTRAKIITHSHGTKFENSSGWTRYLANKILDKINYSKVVNSTDYFFCCSKKAGIALFGQEYSDRLIVIPNGIDLNVFRFNTDNRECVREELGVDQTTRVIGLIGRVSTQKNPVRAISIFANYLKTNPNSVLVIVGEGPLLDDVKASIQKENIQKNVRLLGYRNDIGKILSALDVLIMPSLFEGLPLTAIEAQANGLGCVLADTITDEVKVTELVNFCKLDDSDDIWSKSISELLSDIPERRVQFYQKVKTAGYDVNDALEYVANILRRK